MDLTELFPTVPVKIIHPGARNAYGEPVAQRVIEVEAVPNLNAGRIVDKYGEEHDSRGTLALPKGTDVNTDCLVEFTFPGETTTTQLAIISINYVSPMARAFFPDQVIITLGEPYVSRVAG